MKRATAAAFALAAPFAAFAGDLKPAPYAPMAYFAGLDGKTFSAQWKDAKGTYTDVVRYDLILGGRALQSTHRIKENGYGGRTIFFWDEGAKKYVFHYFTSAGFHTSGEFALKNGAVETAETVNGHPTIAGVRSSTRFSPDKIEVNSVYVGKNGEETPNPPRIYAPVADPGPLFEDSPQ